MANGLTKKKKTPLFTLAGGKDVFAGDPAAKAIGATTVGQGLTQPPQQTEAQRKAAVIADNKARAAALAAGQQLSVQEQTFRPPTEQQKFLTDTAIQPTPTGRTDEEIDLGIAKTILKQRFGDQFDDEAISRMAQLQLKGTQVDTTALQEQQAAGLRGFEEREERLRGELAVEREAERRRIDRELGAFRTAQEATAAEQSAIAERQAERRTAQEGRLLGATGQLTSSVGAGRLGDIQDALSQTLSSIASVKAANIALQEGQLRKASKAQLAGLQANLDAATERREQFVFESEQALLAAKQEAQQLGDTARMELIQGAQDQLSVEKLASKFDKGLTETINDGFIYGIGVDGKPERMTGAEGNFFTFDNLEELSALDLLKIEEKGLDIEKKRRGLTDESGGKQLSGADVKFLSEGQQLPLVLEPLDKILTDKKDLFGPVSGLLTKSPLAVERRKIDDDLRRASQVVGRFMEGGVLRKEDEEKYRKMLPQITDVHEVAVDKLKGVKDLLVLKQQQFVDDFKNAGFDVSGFEGAAQPAAPPGATDLEGVFGDFLSESQTSLNGTDVSGIKDGSQVGTILGAGVATGIERGSRKSATGFDFVLAGGRGANVPAPFSGTVVRAGKAGGFGNQVKLKLDDGKEIWLSHLQAIDVKKGQRIQSGQIIGKQGNTGSVIGGAGEDLTPEQIAAGRGTHLDIQVVSPKGKRFSSQQVASLLQTKLV